MLYKQKITGKPLKYFPETILYYEISQHLTFFNQRNIDYEPGICSVLKNYIKEGDIIFDIGCNIGQDMTLFSNWVPNGKVYSFEPDYKNYSYLIKK